MPGRPGCFLGVDMQHMKKEKRQIIRKNKETTKRQKDEAELSNIELGNYYNFNTENIQLPIVAFYSLIILYIIIL
jgi:hypothetical protein